MIVQSVETIVERKKEIETLKREMARETRERGRRVAAECSDGSRRISSPIFQEGRAKRIIDINAEVDALEMVNRTLFADLHDVNLLKEQKAAGEDGVRALVGGVRCHHGCHLRLSLRRRIEATLIHANAESDPISFALHLFLANKSIHVDPEVLAQYLSLLLIAFLVIN